MPADPPPGREAPAAALPPAPSAGREVLRALLALLRSLFLFVAAIVIWVEEFGWRPLVAWAARLARWPPLARLEDLVRASRPRVALGLFLVPAVALFPVKLGALWLIHQGHGMLGVGVIVAAKVFGTALVGRLFVLVERQLRQFSWLARALDWWQATKLRVKTAVRESAVWRRAKRAGRRARAAWRRWRRRLQRR